MLAAVLNVSDPELRALVSGESVIAFVPRGTVAEGDEVELSANGPLRPDQLKPAYRRWADAGVPEGEWTAIVDVVSPAAALDPTAGGTRHILDGHGSGDLVVLRVYGDDGPVLSDEAFDARVRSVTGALIR